MDTDATYLQVCDKMLRTYNLTTTDYRKRYFNLEPKTDETMTAYVHRFRIALTNG